jgi:DMSO reductase anchor subunit
MLLLTQMSVGMFAVLAAAAVAGRSISTIAVYAATGLLLLGLAVSVLHLGRPMGAWRFFLGLRTSWMSREILAFTLLAGAACTACAAAWFDYRLPVTLGLTAAMGLIAVFTSIMIYVDTHRPFWNLGLTAGKFLGSAGVLGTAAVAVLSQSREMTAAALLARMVCFAWEQAQIRGALDDDDCPWQLSARVMKLRLAHVGDAREGLFLASMAAAVGALTSSDAACTLWTVLFLLSTLAGQVLERYTFFVAAMGPRMTGGYQP